MNIDGEYVFFDFEGANWDLWAECRQMGFYMVTCYQDAGIGVGNAMKDIHSTSRPVRV